MREIQMPRDRNAELEPHIIKRHQTICNELNKRLWLYVRGMSTSDIQSEI